MVVAACLSLLLAIGQLAENKLLHNETTIRCKFAVFRNIVQIVFVNLQFLIIRSWVYFEYDRDESIFIAKNIISIIFSILDIHELCESRSFNELCKSCFGLICLRDVNRVTPLNDA